MKVFVAGASSEIERAERAIANLRSAGVEVTSTWPETIRAVGAANPRDASDDDRAHWAWGCLDQVEACDELLVLVPPKGTETIGAWIEVSWAIQKGCAVSFAGDSRRTIYGALGDEYVTDDEAIAAIGARASTESVLVD